MIRDERSLAMEAQRIEIAFARVTTGYGIDVTCRVYCANDQISFDARREVPYDQYCGLSGIGIDEAMKESLCEQAERNAAGIAIQDFLFWVQHGKPLETREPKARNDDYDDIPL